MGQRSPQQAIRQYLTNGASRVFSQAKKDLKKQASHKLLKLKKDIPTVRELENKFTTEACSEKAQIKIENIFKKINKKLTKIEEILNSSHLFCEKQHKRVSEVNTKVLNKLTNSQNTGILDILKPAIDALNVVLIVGPLALQALGGIGTGGIIGQLTKALKKAEDKQGLFLRIISGYNSIIPTYQEKASKLLNTINKAKVKIEETQAIVFKQKVLLEYLYLQYVTNCNIIEDNIEESEEIITLSVNDIIDDANTDTGISDNLSLAFQQLNETLQNQGMMRIAERLYALEFNHINLQYEPNFDKLKSYKVKLVSIEANNS